MAGADDVVKAALKLIAGSGDDAAKRIASIRRSEPFPADYIEPGSVRYRYEHPDTSSFMEIITRPKGARSASVIGLEVPEEYRGTGIGKALQERVLQDYPSLMGQVSSKAAAVNAYKAGRRPLANPNATIEDVFKMIDEDSSVNLATPKNTGGSIREGYGPGGWVDDVVKMAGKVISGEGEDAAKAGIRAYHGSPHDFDRFDMSKIGTGEGAQAYGHGLYFAEREGVAKGYRDALSSNKFSYGNVRPDDEAIQKFSNHLSNIERRKAELVDKDGFISLDASADDLASLQAEEDKIRNMMVMDTINRNPHLQYGRMYEVNINADPNAFLDWDKPLSEQPSVMEKLKPLLDDPAINQEFVPKFTGKDIMSADGPLSNYIGPRRTPADYRGVLKSEGIPGIKYLDAGSRGAGDGTRNYVVFDDKLISIIRKYGIAGASAMLGYNLMEQLDPKQALAASMADQEYQASRPQRSMGGNNSISGALNVARGMNGGK